MVKVQINIDEGTMYIFSTEKSKLDIFDIAREITDAALVHDFLSLSWDDFSGNDVFHIHFNISEGEGVTHNFTAVTYDDINMINHGDIVRLPIW